LRSSKALDAIAARRTEIRSAPANLNGRIVEWIVRDGKTICELTDAESKFDGADYSPHVNSLCLFPRIVERLRHPHFPTSGAATSCQPLEPQARGNNRLRES
jgi:hypothetical protein